MSADVPSQDGAVNTKPSDEKEVHTRVPNAGSARQTDVSHVPAILSSLPDGWEAVISPNGELRILKTASVYTPSVPDVTDMILASDHDADEVSPHTELPIETKASDPPNESVQEMHANDIESQTATHHVARNPWIWMIRVVGRRPRAALTIIIGLALLIVGLVIPLAVLGSDCGGNGCF
jgi:hypothetical protein